MSKTSNKTIRLHFARASSPRRARAKASMDVHDPQDIARAQNELLREALGRRPPPPADENDAGENHSLAPYARTEPRRRAIALAAARVTSSDVVYDLGSGDGAVLIDAAERYGCACVGLELDASLVKTSEEEAKRRGVDDLVAVRQCDLTRVRAETLARGIEDLPPPTVAYAWLTGGGLSRFSSKLREAWEVGDFRIVTCVDSLDACVDFERDGAFAEHIDRGWEVHRGKEAEFGVFVVPPKSVSLEKWAREERAC